MPLLTVVSTMLALLSKVLVIVSLFQRVGAGCQSTAQSIAKSPTHQNPQVAPPVPIIALSDLYINTSSINTTSLPPSRYAVRDLRESFGVLERRDGPELCGPGLLCPDKSCCGPKNTCGYGPDFCGAGCSSNCDAYAMCGRYGEAGAQKCGMNLCCSYYGWCGTDELHCGDPDPHGLTPCQEEFGLCEIIPPPSCAVGSGNINKRTIGYYQASNIYDRVCNKITPEQIVTTDLTHLYYAFVQFDPTIFTMVPTHEDLYTRFTALKSNRLETWVAIGGFDFSDPGPTHYAWTNMTSTQANRATFISSLKNFIQQYGFQGVDLDWEYPAATDRGGHLADTANFVLLLQEMRANFGNEYGISVTLAPDYWYLRWFDAKGMEPSVDWFGFMAYDLHGFWDADIRTLGAVVRGQTNIQDIRNDALPLWFDALDPAKINFGLAYYGRGYTLADPRCNTWGCPFSGPSKPGPCTNFPGVMSLIEIQHMIQVKGIIPILNETAIMKSITWADQWIGYDDADTIMRKKAWADGECFGGTMIWSVDFNSGVGSGLSPPVTTNGTCGVNYGGTVCGNWETGDCCSSSGFCGSGAAYCGNGCQSGSCVTGGVTTDGTCGTQWNDAICGNWSTGSCCSPAGFCGTGEAYCGSGCQSGPCDSGSGIVIIDPSIWLEPNPTVACFPPCSFVLPPWILSSPTTISVAPITEVIIEPLTSTDNAGATHLTTVTLSTTVSIPALTISTMGLYGIGWTVSSISETSTSTGLFASISVPPVTLTLSNSATSTLIPILYTYSPGIVPFSIATTSLTTSTSTPVAGNPTGTTIPPPGSPTATTTPLPPGQSSGGGQGGSTQTIGPPPGTGGGLHLTLGFPAPTCIDNCPLPCLTNCGPGGSGGGSGGGGEGPDDCSTQTVASLCTIYTSSSVISPATTPTTWSWSVCDPTVGCSVTGSTTSSTIEGEGPGITAPAVYTDNFDDQIPIGFPFTTDSSLLSYASCTHYFADPDRGINSGYCVCSGTTYAEVTNTLVNPPNSCAYLGLPATSTQAVSTTTFTSDCQLCSSVANQPESCTSIPDCVPVIISLTTPTAAPTTSTPPPSSTQSPNPSSTPSPLCGGIGLDLFSDGNCQNRINQICLEIYTCFNALPYGWSSMRRNNDNYETINFGGPVAGVLTAYTVNNCGCPTCGSHGYSTQDTGCLREFGFTANAVGVWF